MKYCIALDIGGTNIRGTWILDNGSYGNIYLKKRPKDLQGTKNTIKSIIDKIKDELTRPIYKIGVASAGPLDYKKKKYLNPVNMPELKNFSIGKFIEDTYNVECILENDAQAAALGEIIYGSLKGKKNGITITLGTGVGTGVIIDKKIWRANHITGPELGHLYLGGNKICGCGQVGCAETLLNEKALIDLSKTHGINVNNTKELYLFANNNLKRIEPILEEYGRYLAIFICQLQVIFCINNFCISGGISPIAKLALTYIQSLIEKRFLKQQIWMPHEITFSANPNLSGLLGIAALCFEDQK